MFPSAQAARRPVPLSEELDGVGIAEVVRVFGLVTSRQDDQRTDLVQLPVTTHEHAEQARQVVRQLGIVERVQPREAGLQECPQAGRPVPDGPGRAAGAAPDRAAGSRSTRSSASSSAVAPETSTWPPWAMASSRAARL